MNRMQAERQAFDRQHNDVNATYVAEMVAQGVWEVKRYPRQKKSGASQK